MNKMFHRNDKLLATNGGRMGVRTRDFIKACSLVVLLSLGMTNVAIAAGNQTGQVVRIFVRQSDHVVLVDITGTPTNKPACAPYTYWIIKDETSLTGKQQLALLMLAKATGLTVNIAGTGDCTRFPSGEDIDVVIVQ